MGSRTRRAQCCASAPPRDSRRTFGGGEAVSSGYMRGTAAGPAVKERAPLSLVGLFPGPQLHEAEEGWEGSRHLLAVPSHAPCRRW